jgi:membrane-bound inhibitor of C-type lysozyme
MHIQMIIQATLKVKKGEQQYQQQHHSNMTDQWVQTYKCKSLKVTVKLIYQVSFYTTVHIF